MSNRAKLPAVNKSTYPIAPQREVRLATSPATTVEQQIESLARRLDEMEIAGGPPTVVDGSRANTESDKGLSGQDSNALNQVDRRIVESSTEEAFKWLEVRGEILKQNESTRDREHIRKMEAWAISGKIALSAGAIASGVALAFGGFGSPAFICLGAGLYGLAPEFINALLRRRKSGGN